VDVPFGGVDFLARVFDYVVNDAVDGAFDGLGDGGEVCVALRYETGIFFGGGVFGGRVQVQGEKLTFGRHFGGMGRWLNDVRFWA